MKKLLLLLIVVVSAGSAMAQSKIAHVNSQAVLDTSAMRAKAITQFQEFEAAGIKELQEMQADLEKAYATYEQKRPTMSPVIQKIEEEKLLKKQKALQDRDQSFQTELQAYSNELNAPILKMVQDAVQAVADTKKLDYVIDVSVVLIANGEDITDEVITELLKMEAEASTGGN